MCMMKKNKKNKINSFQTNLLTTVECNNCNKDYCESQTLIIIVIYMGDIIIIIINIQSTPVVLLTLISDRLEEKLIKFSSRTHLNSGKQSELELTRGFWSLNKIIFFTKDQYRNAELLSLFHSLGRICTYMDIHLYMYVHSETDSF